MSDISTDLTQGSSFLGKPTKNNPSLNNTEKVDEIDKGDTKYSEQLKVPAILQTNYQLPITV